MQLNRNTVSFASLATLLPYFGVNLAATLPPSTTVLHSCHAVTLCLHACIIAGVALPSSSRRIENCPPVHACAAIFGGKMPAFGPAFQPKTPCPASTSTAERRAMTAATTKQSPPPPMTSMAASLRSTTMLCCQQSFKNHCFRMVNLTRNPDPNNNNAVRTRMTSLVHSVNF